MDSVYLNLLGLHLPKLAFQNEPKCLVLKEITYYEELLDK